MVWKGYFPPPKQMGTKLESPPGYEESKEQEQDSGMTCLRLELQVCV